MSNTVHRLIDRPLHLVLVCALLGTAPRPTQAQGADSNVAAAQAVGTAFLKAVQAADWKAAASFLDLVPLDHFRLQQVDVARRSRQMTGGITVEQFMKSDSTMPRAVAEYQVKRMREAEQRFNFLEYQFGVTDADSLAAMPTSVAAEHWLEAHDPRWRMKAMYKRSNCPPELADSIAKPNFRVLGTVVNGATAYVLYERDDDAPVDFNQVQGGGPHMLTLRRGLDQWWVLPRESSGSGVAMGVMCNSVPLKPK